MESHTSAPRTRWVGWIAFGAIFMFINGLFGFIVGLVALLKDDFFVVDDGRLVAFDITTWAWIHIIFSVLLMVLAAALAAGKPWALITSAVLVGVHMVAQFTFLSVSPVWSAVSIAVDAAVIWAIIVHGGEAAT